MRERLAPFDFEAFKKDPARLRSSAGSKPFRAGEALGDSVAVVWCAGDPGTVYLPHEFYVLRLAANAVKVRLYRDHYDRNIFVTSETSVDLNSRSTNWCSDIIEIPVTA